MFTGGNLRKIGEDNFIYRIDFFKCVTNTIFWGKVFSKNFCPCKVCAKIHVCLGADTVTYVVAIHFNKDNKMDLSVFTLKSYKPGW